MSMRGTQPRSGSKSSGPSRHCPSQVKLRAPRGRGEVAAAARQLGELDVAVEALAREEAVVLGAAADGLAVERPALVELDARIEGVDGVRVVAHAPGCGQ